MKLKMTFFKTIYSILTLLVLSGWFKQFLATSITYILQNVILVLVILLQICFSNTNILFSVRITLRINNMKNPDLEKIGGRKTWSSKFRNMWSF